MNKLIAILGMIVSTCSFAHASSTSFSKNSPALNSLSSAWKAHHANQPTQIQNDIAMVYGGADVSLRASNQSHLVTA